MGRGDPDDDKAPRGLFAHAPNTGAVLSGPGDDQLPAEPTYVKLMPDYGADVPLWGVPWQNLNLGAPLLARLRAWQAQFDAHFHYARGWDDGRIADEWRAEREQLAVELRSAVGPDIEVQVDSWPD